MNTTLPLPRLQFKHHLPFPVQDIMRLDGNGSYTVLVLSDGTEFLSSRNLGLYETMLPDGFLRVHKQSIINTEYLQSLNETKQRAVLSDGTEVSISRRRWLEVKQRFAA